MDLLRSVSLWTGSPAGRTNFKDRLLLAWTALTGLFVAFAPQILELLNVHGQTGPLWWRVVAAGLVVVLQWVVQHRADNRDVMMQEGPKNPEAEMPID